MKYHQLLENIITQAEGLIHVMDYEALAKRPAPDKWSKKEIIGHLIDSAYNNHQRFVRATSQENLVFQGYDQNEWVRRNQYQSREVDELLTAWATANRHLAKAIESLPEELRKRKTTDHNFHQICMNILTEGEETSLKYLVWDYIWHLEHHLGQIVPGYERSLGEFKG